MDAEEGEEIKNYAGYEEKEAKISTKPWINYFKDKISSHDTKRVYISRIEHFLTWLAATKSLANSKSASAYIETLPISGRPQFISAINLFA